MTTLERFEETKAYARARARFCRLDDVWTDRLVRYACVLFRKSGDSTNERLRVSSLIAHKARRFAQEPQQQGNVSQIIERTARIARDELSRSNPTPPEAA